MDKQRGKTEVVYNDGLDDLNTGELCVCDKPLRNDSSYLNRVDWKNQPIEKMPDYCLTKGCVNFKYRDK